MRTIQQNVVAKKLGSITRCCSSNGSSFRCIVTTLRHKILTGRGWLSRKGEGFPARNREYANFVTLNEMQECEFAGSLSSTMRRESRIKRRPRVTWDHFRLDFLRFETIFPAVVITNNDVNGSYIPCTVESLNRKSCGELRCRMREARRAEDREGRLPFIELPVR